MGEVAEILGGSLRFEILFKITWTIADETSLERLKNHAQIDVSCSGLTGQTKQILHGKGIWKFSSELWTFLFLYEDFLPSTLTQTEPELS